MKHAVSVSMWSIRLIMAASTLKVEFLLTDLPHVLK